LGVGMRSMAEYQLVLRENGVDRSTYTVKPEGYVIGRASDCDLTLLDNLVSRRHARLWIEDEHLHVENLGSRNGIFVNGRQVDRQRLREQDELVIGNAFFAITRSDTDNALPDTSSMVTYERAERLYQEMVSAEGAGRLPILYKAAQLLGTVFDMDKLLQQVLGLIFEAVPARRGYVLLSGPGNGTPSVRASIPPQDSPQGPPLSMTLVRHVFTHRNAVLTLNAQQDQRFSASDSVVSHGIHSAICAPLCGRDGMVGAIYIDSGSEPVTFTNEELELVTAIGRVVGIALENARLHQERMASERLAAVGQATAGIGHCVRNILVGIKGGGEFVDLAVERGDIKLVERGWGLVRRSVDRIEDLVLNLLSYSREHDPELESNRLDLLITEVFDVCRARIRGEVSFDLKHGDIGYVRVDGREFFRVLLNLVMNAVEACGEGGGTVTVTTRLEEDGCCIDIADTGPGISPQVKDRLFQAFVSTKGSQGTGLGLACSDRIVRAHGGKITVRSEEGKGAVFTIHLPASLIVDRRQTIRND
jgi:signal transduction histidine kinase